MFDPNQMLKQMLDFNKTAFDNSFKAMLTIGEQNEKMLNTFLSQATWLPEEGKKLVQNWVDAYNKGCQDFKKTADDNYKKVAEFFEAAAKIKIQIVFFYTIIEDTDWFANPEDHHISIDRGSQKIAEVHGLAAHEMTPTCSAINTKEYETHST